MWTATQYKHKDQGGRFENFALVFCVKLKIMDSWRSSESNPISSTM